MVDGAGRVAVGGAGIDPRGALLRVVRFDRDGRADTAFGEGGFVDEAALTADPGAHRTVCAAMCDGRVTCFANDRGGGVSAVRWLADGRDDPSFGASGYLSLLGRRESRAVALDPRDGSLRVVTRSGRDGAVALHLWRVLP